MARSNDPVNLHPEAAQGLDMHSADEARPDDRRADFCDLPAGLHSADSTRGSLVRRSLMALRMAWRSQVVASGSMMLAESFMKGRSVWPSVIQKLTCIRPARILCYAVCIHWGCPPH